MTNSEESIIKAALLKAIDRGFTEVGSGMVFDRNDILAPKTLIFNHNFARALWGDQPTDWQWETEGGRTVQSGIKFPIYKVHLMLMAIADDPIEYLKGVIE